MEVSIGNTKYRLQYRNYSSTYAKVLSTHLTYYFHFIVLLQEEKKIKTNTK